VHLAVAAEMAGDGPVVISDTDPQGSTVDWFNQRKKVGLAAPQFGPLALSDLRNRLRAFDEAGVRYLFIDTAPSIGGMNQDLFKVADLILIPLNPTPTDLRALVKGLPVIKQSGRLFYFMLTRVRPTLRNNDSTATALETVGVLLPPRMHERVIYAESFAHGKTAFEIDPHGVAAQELAAIWIAMKERLAKNGSSAGRQRSKESVPA
jgi:chromosome partitioning protein